MILRIQFSLIIFSLFFSCNKKQSLNSTEYVKWLEDYSNGLIVKKEVGDLVYILQFETIEYLQIIQNPNIIVHQKDIVEAKRQLGNTLFFKLRIEMKDKNKDPLTYKISSENDYHQRNTYLMEDFKDNIYLINSKDSIPCVVYSMINNYGLAPYIDFVLGFSSLETSKANKYNMDNKPFVTEDLKLVINDNVFNSGIVQFIIRKKDILNTPKLLVFN